MNKHICRLQIILQFKPCFVSYFALGVVFACCFRMWPTYALYLLLKKPTKPFMENASFYCCPVQDKTCMVFAIAMVISIYYIKIKYMIGDTYTIYLIIKISL